MFAKHFAIAVLLTFAACAPVTPNAGSAGDTKAQGETLAKACTGRDGWSDAAPPARIFGNTYYMGTCGITVLLVTSPKGHVLIDAGPADAAPAVLANISALGFDPRDVRFIVGSHEHADHMGGFAVLKAATGAKLLVSKSARRVVETGKVDPDDPQFGVVPNMPPVPVDGILKGQSARVMSLSYYRTPGHTSGGTSWTWQSCEGGKCAIFAYIDSLTVVSADGYRFTDHPERVAPFRETFDRVAKLPCDILVTPHPGFSDLFDRLRGAKPLMNAAACRNLANAMRNRLDERLAKERAR
jgi:metallo-beta-lactamase class B